MPERVFNSADALRLVRSKYHFNNGIPTDGYMIHHQNEFIKTDQDGNPLNDEGEITTPNKAHTYNQTLASYRLKELPGCCGVMVSYNAAVAYGYQEMGLGEHFHKERLKLAAEMNYSCVLCTVTAQNVAQQNMLVKNGWLMVHSFVNRRTKNTVQIWVKDI